MKLAGKYFLRALLILMANNKTNKMKILRTAALIKILIILPMIMMAQNGFIRGIVYDDQTAETLPGVTVFVEGTSIGSISDFDGKFSISISPGIYDVSVSFISYETLKITGLKVESGKTIILDNLRLKEAQIEIQGVEITAEALRNTEASMLAMKMKSANLADGISAAHLRKIGDSDAASSLKRVPGISLQGGKYVFVRGLGDRYTKTTLNGMEIPGLDPDRNALQLDIFPSLVIDNIIVSKSFTADLPGDFTGGIIDITTKDFPEEKKLSVSANLGLIPSMHFNPAYLTYEGGKTDWLGFDDGSRAIPATDNIPFFSEAIANPDGPAGERYREILNNFNPVLGAIEKQSFMDFGFSASTGNQLNFPKISLGYLAALSYSNETDFYQNAVFGRYGLFSDISVNEMEQREFQTGDYGEQHVMISGLFGLAMKTTKTKIKFNVLHLQDGVSKAGIFDYEKANQGTEFRGYQHNLEYSQRSLSNILLNGKHLLPGKWNLEWKLSPTKSTIYDPDIRFTRYVITEENKLVIGTESGFPERIWRDLSENNYTGKFAFSRDFNFLGNKSEILFGAAASFKERDYIIRSFALNIRPPFPLTGNPDELFYPENLWPRDGEIGSGTTYEARFVPVNPNKFNSSTHMTAGFISFDIRPFERLRSIIGLRMEVYKQFYTGQDQLGTNILDKTEVLSKTDLLPSLNLVYNLRENQNLRFSFTKTIARPSFKELSYAEIFDPISGHTFIGGLFRDADDVQGIEYWNGNLVSTGIYNIDLRWETIQPEGQTLSFSLFFKKFNHPIELVQYATLVGAFQPRNVGDGEVLGGELEIRKNLNFISESLSNFSFNTNFTYTQSKIELSPTEYQSRIANARLGQKIDRYRDMSGQAPYLLNAGIAFNGSEKGFGRGLEAGLYYNMQGETLLIVGIVDRPDIYTVPFHSLNFNASKGFGKDNRMSIGLKIENILNQNIETVFKSYEAADQFYTRLSPGTKFSLRFTYNIF